MARIAARGNLAVIWTDTDPEGSVADLGLGDDLTGVENGEALFEISGFGTSPSSISVPDFVSMVTGKIPGETVVEDGSLRYYMDDTSNPIFSSGPAEGDSGFITFCPAGVETGAPYVTYPVIVQTKLPDAPSLTEAASWTMAVAPGVPTIGTLTA